MTYVDRFPEVPPSIKQQNVSISLLLSIPKRFLSDLGNYQSVVNNLGTLRNKMGDAHGRRSFFNRPDYPNAANPPTAKRPSMLASCSSTDLDRVDGPDPRHRDVPWRRCHRPANRKEASP